LCILGKCLGYSHGKAITPFLNFGKHQAISFLYLQKRYTFYRDTSSAFLICNGTPNELRIDAAEAEKIKAGMVCAAASIRVGLSRTPENTNHLEIKGQVLAGNPQPNRKSTDQ
jgi:hypothetical protein